MSEHRVEMLQLFWVASALHMYVTAELDSGLWFARPTTENASEKSNSGSVMVLTLEYIGVYYIILDSLSLLPRSHDCRQ